MQTKVFTKNVQWIVARYNRKFNLHNNSDRLKRISSSLLDILDILFLTWCNILRIKLNLPSQSDVLLCKPFFLLLTNLEFSLLYLEVENDLGNSTENFWLNFDQCKDGEME